MILTAKHTEKPQRAQKIITVSLQTLWGHGALCG